MPLVEKTSLFGTAVHAVLRSRHDARRTICARRCRRPGSRVDQRRRRSCRRSRTCSSTSSIASSGERRVRRVWAVAREGAAADPPRPPDAAHPAVHPGVLPVSVRLRAELRHPPRDAGGARIATSRAESRALIASVRAVDVLRSGRDRAIATREIDDADRPRARPRACSSFPRASRAGSRPRRVADVQVILNGDNANTATTVLGYANAVLLEASAALGGAGDGRADRRRRAAHLVQPGTAQHAVPRARPHRLHLDDYGRRLDGAVDRAREGDAARWSRCAWRRSRRSAFVVGKTLPYLVLSQASAMLVIARGDGVVRPADARQLAGARRSCVAVFLVGALGTGLLVSTIADTQQVAFQAAMLIAFLPTFMLSGFIFPIASMPVALQYITTIVPARYFLIALRGIVLKGLGLADAVAPLAGAGRLRRRRARPVGRCGWRADETAHPHAHPEGVPRAAADAAAARARSSSRRSSS